MTDGQRESYMEGYMEDDSSRTEYELSDQVEDKTYLVVHDNGETMKVLASDTVGVEALALVYGWPGLGSAEGYLDNLAHWTELMSHVKDEE